MKKKVIIALSAVFVLAFALILLAALSVGKDTKPVESSLRNPENIFSDTPDVPVNVSQLDAEKATPSDELFDGAGVKIRQYLSQGRFHELELYTANLIDEYGEPSDSEGRLAMEHIRGVRADAATVGVLDYENSESLTTVFSTSDGLASAVVFAPVSCKFRGYLNWGGALIIPPKSGTDVQLVEVAATEDELAEVDDLNRNAVDSYVGMAKYQATCNGHTFNIYLLQYAETGFWRINTVRPADGDYSDLKTVSGAYTMANMLEATNNLYYLDEYYGQNDISMDEVGVVEWADRESNVPPDWEFETFVEP